MATIIAVGGFFAALFTTALSRLFADELKAWMPRIIESTIRHAVDQLPVGQRERYGEEWRSYVGEAPGEIGKLLRALGLLLAAPKMASILNLENRRVALVLGEYAQCLVPTLLMPFKFLFRHLEMLRWFRRAYEDLQQLNDATDIAHGCELLSVLAVW